MGRIWETPKEEKETFFKKLFFYIDTLESQPMAFVPWWLLFIIKPIHHLVFGVGRIQTPDILFNHKTTSWAKQNSQSKRKIFHT